ncbi:MAG: YafY family transcriptional regulator [Oscillospiraceae bacterium]|nr:YafY family transcriptional regulator [Oscillospiraceae bacterium]
MKLDRLLGIVTLLLQNDRMTAPELAEIFEVSRRTIGRDIDALCVAGIPIVTAQGAGGGIAIAEGFTLDKNVLRDEELPDLIAAVQGLGSVSDDAKTALTLDKLGAKSDKKNPIKIDLASYYKGQLTEKIALIKRAVRESRLIVFDYYSQSGHSRRCIEPYIALFQWSSWYVFGFCIERQDWRMFKLQRLWDLNTRDETFAPREIPPDRQDFGMNFTDDIELTALFDSSEKYRLIEAYGLGSYEETNDGLLFAFGFENRAFLLNWLLGFGDKVKVLAPDDIAREIQDIAEKILLKYR